MKSDFNARDIISRLTDGYYLSKGEAVEIVERIVSQDISPILLGSILSLMNTRPFACDEVLGFRKGILNHSKTIDLSSFDPIDVCGTGGDGRNSFNISTAAALLIASVGVPVAKHGNYAVSSNCGSSNILEAMGYQATNDVDKIKRELEKTNFTFLHAPLFHPAMKEVAPIRKELGIKTIFNCLGPLLNPASVRYQLAGVYSVSLFNLYRQVLTSLCKERGGEFCVVFSTDIADEITLTAPARIAFKDNEVLLRPGGHISYEGVSFPLVLDADIKAPGGISESVTLMESFLKGEAPKHLEDVVVANAAFGIFTKDSSRNFKQINEDLKSALQDGRAYRNTQKLLEIQ